MGAAFSSMQTKWRVFGVIGIIAVVLFGLQLLGLVIAAIMAGAFAAGTGLGGKLP